MKDRFLEAVANGELGEVDDFGVVVSLKQFKSYFNDVTSDYVNSFLPAAVIETGQRSATHTKYLFRIRKGVYRVHPDAIEEHRESQYVASTESSAETGLDTNLAHLHHSNNKVEEALIQYQQYRYN